MLVAFPGQMTKLYVDMFFGKKISHTFISVPFLMLVSSRIVSELPAGPL